MTAIVLRVVGGGNFPTEWLRVSASYPLAVFELSGDRLTLRLRWYARD
jgi:hypothetical protein